MSKTYTKISETEVKVTETNEISVDTIYTEAVLNTAVDSIDTEIAQLNARKVLLQAELAEVHETLNP